jgi:methionine biosynthesis protein MetW
MTEMQLQTMAADPERIDLQVITGFVTPGARVLDVGCGDGALLQLLEDQKGVDGRGVELSQKGVNLAEARGLSVVQGDADHDLATYPDEGFDFVILSQTLQATHNPRVVLEQLLRIGRKVIVSFPNFGNWRIRAQFLFGGHMPVTENLPYSWYDTPNIHFFTIRDFTTTVREMGAKIETGVALTEGGRSLHWRLPWWVWNVFGQQAVFLIRR